ncbi:hypothetical protein NA57DRAFT_58007 [Rhizodiscina lignyota]|uniref:Uncharacterized protein n=1 Tax=Rhizodiscina lignyota TaxID=1504668 RepID=A0A9P4IDM8_9PEZI|nr:hypothetical protein NA57DRAFT_58007 [Rhizodiscina lignyota]
MPSRLRIQTNFEEEAQAYSTNSRTSSPPQKKQKMSLSQTYFIAASARTKLGKEACRPDHNLRLLVGHANLLDSLMLDLHEAEREQEAWFNQTVQKAAKAEEPKHIQWIDTIQEDAEEDEELDDAASDTSDSDDDEEDYTFSAPLRRIRSPPVSITTQEVDSDDEFEDLEDDEEHALVRTVSGQSAQQPPELVDDSDSDDESPPTSPPHLALEFSEQQRQAIATTAFFDQKGVVMTGTEEADFVENGYFIPDRNQAPLIAAC